MALHNSLGDRMKEYESRNQYFLQRRTPVCIRVDMRAGHTFTKGFVRPFDEVFGNAMVRTMEYCAKNIGNCVFSYCQSDEITFILVDYKKLETNAWFDYRTDKLCSISASMATMAFNKFFANEVARFRKEKFYNSAGEDQYAIYLKAAEKGAMFDARCFNIPKEEVTNLVYWRQLDATRNSIQMVGQANFSHNELQGCSCNVIQDMLHEQCGINWNDYPTRWKRGTACRKFPSTLELKEKREEKDWGEPETHTEVIQHYEWKIDFNMPILKGEGRTYVDEVIYIGEE